MLMWTNSSLTPYLSLPLLCSPLFYRCLALSSYKTTQSHTTNRKRITLQTCTQANQYVTPESSGNSSAQTTWIRWTEFLPGRLFFGKTLAVKMYSFFSLMHTEISITYLIFFLYASSEELSGLFMQPAEDIIL